MTTTGNGEKHVLRSWKEIATYLKVDVRTAQRWFARTDIPISKRQVGSRTHPFANPEELDQWMLARPAEKKASVAIIERPLFDGLPAAEPAGHNPAALPPMEDPPEASLPDSGRPRFRNRPLWVWVVASTAFAAILLRVAVFFVGGNVDDQPRHVDVERGNVRAFSEDNRLLWQKTLPGTGRVLPDVIEGAPSQSYLVEDINDDKRREVLVNVVSGGKTPGHLVAYGADGDLLWDYRYEKTRSWRGKTYDPKYNGTRLTVVRNFGKTYLLAVAAHEMWFPAQVLLIDPLRGTVIDEYWHPGALRSALVHDIDGDGQNEAVLTGINNPGEGLGHGALVALKIPFAHNTIPPDDEMAVFSGGREALYALFPRPDTCSVLGNLPWLADPAIENDGFRVRTGCANASVMHLLDFSMRLREVRLTDNYAPLHVQLEQQHYLHHAFSARESTCLSDILVSRFAVNGNDFHLSERWKACE